MSDLKLPGEDEGKRKPISIGRIAIWAIVGAIGLGYLITGLVGVATK